MLTFALPGLSCSWSQARNCWSMDFCRSDGLPVVQTAAVKLWGVELQSMQTKISQIQWWLLHSYQDRLIPYSIHKRQSPQASIRQLGRGDGGNRPPPTKNMGTRVSFRPKMMPKSTKMYWFACKITKKFLGHSHLTPTLGRAHLPLSIYTVHRLPWALCQIWWSSSAEHDQGKDPVPPQRSQSVKVDQDSTSPRCVYESICDSMLSPTH